MTTIVRTSNVCCGTCQSWSGTRKYEPRLDRISCEWTSTSMLEPCSMKYKKSPGTPACSCKGYVRWCGISR